ncbi:MAG: hypothetical protein JWM59_1353 [Verrucomicrobiales bacterium]|nr:hypothetical protein [Verrucomicrobiales bacterium]
MASSRELPLDCSFFPVICPVRRRGKPVLPYEGGTGSGEFEWSLGKERSETEPEFQAGPDRGMLSRQCEC